MYADANVAKARLRISKCWIVYPRRRSLLRPRSSYDYDVGGSLARGKEGASMMRREKSSSASRPGAIDARAQGTTPRRLGRPHGRRNHQVKSHALGHCLGAHFYTSVTFQKSTMSGPSQISRTIAAHSAGVEGRLVRTSPRSASRNSLFV
jgi:hypothetical protein